MITLGVGLVLAPLLYVASTLWYLIRNYRSARAVGVPIVICPYDPDNYVHALVCVPLRPLYQFLLPRILFSTVELSIWGWEFRDKGAIHEKLGPTFILVTTGQNRLVSADPVLAQHILVKRNAFVHPEVTTQAMGFLGANIVTAQGEAWSRQRRIIVPSLNDRISPAVWKESATQASALAEFLVSSSASRSVDKSAQTIAGLRTVAINVLAHVAYGHHKQFALHDSSRKGSWDMTYVDAISLCTEQLILAAFVPAWLLSLPIMPQLLQTLGTALRRLPGLTGDMLQQERHQSYLAAPNANQTGLGNHPQTIMSTLVRLSDQEKNRENDISTGSGKDSSASIVGSSTNYLTEEEIAGNLFIFTAAGFDTTANTMGYAVALLAACPHWQAWVQAEIDDVMGGPTQRRSDEMQLPDYATNFPRLVRCIAIMLETLRLFPPVTLLMRANEADQTVSMAVSSRDSPVLSSKYAIGVNVMALHASKSIWGPDALEFNPARWLQPSTEQGSIQKFIQPPRGTYIPWSMGPRSCPGQKMSQVEFVTVIATLFGQCTAEPVVRLGETTQEARERLLNSMQDSQPVLTLQMNNPKDIHIHWTARCN